MPPVGRRKKEDATSGPFCKKKEVTWALLEEGGYMGPFGQLI
jgi:hypothetical protein